MEEFPQITEIPKEETADLRADQPSDKYLEVSDAMPVRGYYEHNDEPLKVIDCSDPTDPHTGTLFINKSGDLAVEFTSKVGTEILRNVRLVSAFSDRKYFLTNESAARLDEHKRKREFAEAEEYTRKSIIFGCLAPRHTRENTMPESSFLSKFQDVLRKHSNLLYYAHTYPTNEQRYLTGFTVDCSQFTVESLIKAAIRSNLNIEKKKLNGIEGHCVYVDSAPVISFLYQHINIPYWEEARLPDNIRGLNIVLIPEKEIIRIRFEL